MAIIFYINGCGKYFDNAARADVANYIARSKDFITGGYGIDLQHPAQSMQRHAENYDKNNAKRLHHFIIALAPGVRVSAQHLKIAMDLIAADIGRNYLVFYGIHTDTENIHVHMMINAVGMDGKKFRGDWKSLRNIEKIIRNRLSPLGDRNMYLAYKNVPDKYMRYIEQ